MRRVNSLWTLLLLAAMGSFACIGGTDGKLLCATDADCHEGYTCDLNTTKVCLRSCTEANEKQDCLASQRCDVAPGDAEGVCREGASSATDGGGDAGGGDAGAGDAGGDAGSGE